MHCSSPRGSYWQFRQTCVGAVCARHCPLARVQKLPRTWPKGEQHDELVMRCVVWLVPDQEAILLVGPSARIVAPCVTVRITALGTGVAALLSLHPGTISLRLRAH